MRIYRDIDGQSGRLPGGFLVRLEDAARWLGVSDESLRRYIESGRLGAIREQGTPGRMGWRWVVPTEELNRVRALSRKTERTILP